VQVYETSTQFLGLPTYICEIHSLGARVNGNLRNRDHLIGLRSRAIVCRLTSRCLLSLSIILVTERVRCLREFRYVNSDVFETPSII
jgi:hypothetical protein